MPQIKLLGIHVQDGVVRCCLVEAEQWRDGRSKMADPNHYVIKLKASRHESKDRGRFYS